MNIEQLDQQVIINEWQLGQQLNRAVHKGTREKFNLLLSFLSADARDFAQFAIKPQIDEPNDKNDLRKHFNLNAAQPLVNEGPSEVLLAELNKDLQQTKMHEIRFKQLLTNEALLCKKVSNSLPRDVLDNLPLIKQKRVNEAYQSAMSASIKEEQPIDMVGVDAHLLDEYGDLDLQNRPVQIRYK
jgi:hypothetical protein